MRFLVDSAGSHPRTLPEALSSRSSYANNQNCQFDIRVSSGYAVRLTWTTFDVKGDMPNCYDDYVEIYITFNYVIKMRSMYCEKFHHIDFVQYQISSE